MSVRITSKVTLDRLPNISLTTRSRGTSVYKDPGCKVIAAKTDTRGYMKQPDWEEYKRKHPSETGGTDPIVREVLST